MPHSIGNGLRTLDLNREIEPKWSLSFLALLLYLAVEYARLPAIYPVLIPLELGKVVVVLGLLGLIFSPRRSAVIPPEVRRIDIAVAFFTFGALLSALGATYQDHAWGYLWGLVDYVLLYFLIGRVVNRAWRLRVFVGTFLIICLKLTQFVLRSYRYQLNHGISAASLAGGIGAGSNGFFANGTDFGALMCVTWPIATILLLADMKRRYKIMFLLLSFAFLLGVIFCGSRGALVGAGAIVLVAIFRRPGKLLGPVMLAALVGAVIFIMPKANLHRADEGIHYQTDADAQSRINFWKTGLEMFENHPLLGVGINNFPPTYRDKYDFDRIPRERVPHSIFIQCVSELGIMGTLPLIFIWFFFLRLNILTRRNLLASNVGRRSFEFCLAVGLDLAFVGYVVTGTFLAVLYYPQFWLLLGLSTGLHLESKRQEQVSKSVVAAADEVAGDLMPMTTGEW